MLYKYRTYFVKKGDNPQNISFRAEARKLFRFTNDILKDPGYLPPILVTLDDHVFACQRGA